MTLRKGEDTLIWRRKLWIALCGELALEEALDRQTTKWMNESDRTCQCYMKVARYRFAFHNFNVFKTTGCVILNVMRSTNLPIESYVLTAWNTISGTGRVRPVEKRMLHANKFYPYMSLANGHLCPIRQSVYELWLTGLSPAQEGGAINFLTYSRSVLHHLGWDTTHGFHGFLQYCKLQYDCFLSNHFYIIIHESYQISWTYAVCAAGSVVKQTIHKCRVLRGIQMNQQTRCSNFSGLLLFV